MDLLTVRQAVRTLAQGDSFHQLGEVTSLQGEEEKSNNMIISVDMTININSAINWLDLYG